MAELADHFEVDVVVTRSTRTAIVSYFDTSTLKVASIQFVNGILGITVVWKANETISSFTSIRSFWNVLQDHIV